MKTFIMLVGLIMTLPFIILEMMIKGILFILYFPMLLIIAMIYPLIKYKNLNWLKYWWKYSTKWKKNYYSYNIFKLWH